jgi:hypothetical protein
LYYNLFEIDSQQSGGYTMLIHEQSEGYTMLIDEQSGGYTMLIDVFN